MNDLGSGGDVSAACARFGSDRLVGDATPCVGLSLSAEQNQAFVRGQAAPYAVRFLDAERVSSAGVADRAFRAHRLGEFYPLVPSGPPFSPGMEEHRAVHPAAGGVQLPFPDVLSWVRQSSDVRHSGSVPM